MAGSFRIAEGFVEVTADESAYDRAMQRLKAKNHTVKVTVDLDDTAALARLHAFAQQQATTVTASISATLVESSVARVAKALDKLTKDRVVRILASADTRVAADEIRNLTRRQRVRIGIDVDTRVAADDIANLTRRRTMTVQARADTADATRALRFLTRDRTVHVRANMSGFAGLGSGGGAAAGGITSLISTVLKLSAVAGSVMPTLVSLGQSIIAMGPAAAVAVPAILSLGAAFAAIKIGTSGIGDAFKAAFAPAVSSGGAAESSTRRVEAAQRSLAKAQQGVKDAEVRAAEARVQAARQVEDAQRSLKSTVQDVADANRRAAQQVAQAEQDLADAQKSARQAQLDLTAARKDAARQLQDLANQQEDVELDRREGVLRVQDAQDELNKTLADPKATEQQRAEAQLTYDQAIQHLEEIQLQQERLTADAAAANKAGVEGSKQVTDAKQQIADANQDVVDKTRELKDAEIEASRTQVEGAQKVAAAERDVADARAAARKAAVDGARDIADAQDAVADAARSMAEAQTAGAAATSKTADAMARLAPNARAFVSAVMAQAGAWRALKLDVQNTLFDGLGAKFTTMSQAILPSLRAGLTGTAGVLNGMAKNAADAVTQLGKTGQLKQMFDGLNEGLKPLSRIPGQFITGLTQISIAASPAFKRLTDAAGGAADGVAKKLGDAFKSGRLEEAINGAIEIAKQFGQFLGDVFGTLGNVLKAAGAAGGDALGALGAVFKELRRITALPEVQEALTSIFKALSDVGKLLAGALGEAIRAVLPLLAALAPVVSALAEKLGPVVGELLSTLGEALTPIMDALLPIIGDIGDALISLVKALSPLLQPLGDLIGAILKAVGPIVKMVGQNLSIIVGALVKGLVPVIAALIPAIAMFGQLFAQLAPLFPPIYEAIAALLPPIGLLLASTVKLAVEALTPLMPVIVKVAEILTGVLSVAIGVLVPVLTTTIGWLIKLQTTVGAVVKWVVDKFTWMYDVLVGHSIIPDLVRAIVKWFTSLWTSTRKIFTDLKNWVVSTWNSLWNAVRSKWDSFWSGLRSALGNAKTSIVNWVSGLRTSVTNTWSSMWNSARDKVTSIFSTINGKIANFRTGMKSAFSNLRDSLGTIWKGVQSKISSPVRWVISNVYNSGIRKMWNAIAGKINSKITLPSISLGFNKGGVVPGQGSGDTVPAMLTPGERILSNQQVASLGGHRGIDAMLGRDQPSKTGGNPTSQQERRRHQATQGFADGGIIGNVTSAIGGAVSSATSWAKDIVVGGLKAAAQKALSALVRPLINQIPGSGIGNLMRGMSNKAVDGMMGWFGNEDKKAVGGPAVQRALGWAKTQDGKPYQWGGNGNPSWDCSGFMSAIESVIRGQSPHRRWATGSFSGSNGPAGWTRNLNSPFMIGITSAGVGHTAGTIGGVNVESRGGGDGVIIGKGARGYNDSLFTSHWGFKPATQFDSGGLLAKGATMAVNNTGRPERILDPRQTELFEQLVNNSGSPGVTVNMTVNSLTMPSPSERKQFANAMAADFNEAIRKWNKGRAR